jgi:hypothetical protein
MSLPNWLLGRHWTSIVVTPITTDESTGGITVVTASAKTMTAFIKGITRRDIREQEAIMPLGTRKINKMTLAVGAEYTLEEFLRNAAGGDSLAAISEAYDYCQIAFTRAGKTYTAQCLVGDYDEPAVRGGNVGTLTISLIDNGAANPVVA